MVRYLVFTESGARHLVDEEAMTVVRVRDVPAPLTWESLYDDLRRDDEALRLYELPGRPVPGLPWVIKLEQLGSPEDYRDVPDAVLMPFTLRYTTPVVAVEELS